LITTRYFLVVVGITITFEISPLKQVGDVEAGKLNDCNAAIAREGYNGV